MKVNEAPWERVLRIVVGVVLFILALAGLASGAWLWVAYVLGALMLLTGLTGFCPLYALLGLSPKRS
jgi:hypothetical protein